MQLIDVTDAYEKLLDRQPQTTAESLSAVSALSDSWPTLASAVKRLLDHDSSKSSAFRLLPYPVMGALGGNPDAALPIAASSQIWWAAAEALDDFLDDQSDADLGLSVSELVIAASACLSPLSLAVSYQLSQPAGLRTRWVRESVTGCLAAAEGQLDDIALRAAPVSWRTVMRTYANKTGSAYARDIAMTAQLAGVGDQSIRGWRAFGQLFGVLRQTVNDRKFDSAEHDEDFMNGTATLHLAHAADAAAKSGELDKLMGLRDRARYNPHARQLLLDWFRDPDVLAAYNHRIRGIGQQLISLLETLAPVSDDRHLIRWMVESSTGAALLTEAELAA